MADKFAHEMELGDSYAPLEIEVSPEYHQQYLYAAQDFDSRYVDGVDGSPPEVHAAMILNLSSLTRSPSFKVAENTGTVMAETECQFLNPAYVGTKLNVTFDVTDIFEKRGRAYQTVSTDMTDSHGRIILKRHTHVAVMRKDKPVC
jgi:hypothetical protein